MGGNKAKSETLQSLLVVFGITLPLGRPPTQCYRRCYVRRGTLQLCGIKSLICRASRARPLRGWSATRCLSFAATRMNSRLFVEVEPKQRFPTPLLRIFEQQPNRFGFQPKGWVMLPSRPRVLATVYKTNRISLFPDWLVFSAKSLGSI
jgi:hypothetical protein